VQKQEKINRDRKGDLGDGKRSTDKGLLPCSKSFVSLDHALTLGNASIVIWSEVVRAGLGRVLLVEFLNDFIGVCEIGGSSPLVFLVSTLVAHPSDVVEELAHRPTAKIIF
jgi:hypothetical protein